MQLISFYNAQGQWIQKEVQRILEERKFWRLNLECPKPKCFNCEIAANYKVCIQGHKYDLYKTPKNQIAPFSKSCK